MNRQNLSTAKLELKLEASAEHASERAGPVQVSVPFPKGQIASTDQIDVIDREGVQQTVQLKTLSRWHDGSIRWCLVEFIWAQSSGYTVIVGAVGRVRTPQSRTNGLMEFCESENESAGGKTRLKLRHRELGQDVILNLRLRHDGQDYYGVCGVPQPVDSGPIRWSQRRTVRFFSDETTSPLEGELIVKTYADFPVMTFEFSIRNPQAMDHPGGNWDLGAAGSIIIEDLSAAFSLADRSDDGRFSVDLRDTGQTVQAAHRLKLFQASSGGENWKSQNHLDRYGKVPLEFRGYRVNADNAEHSGLRAEPVLRLAEESFEAAVACRDFWQNFPKVLEAENETLRIGLFPTEATGGTELQGGEQKTHQFAFELKSLGAESKIEACLNPPIVKLSSADYARGEALPYLTPRSSRSDTRYESLVDQAIEGGTILSSPNQKLSTNLDGEILAISTETMKPSIIVATNT